jgi:hypothetical protein
MATDQIIAHVDLLRAVDRLLQQAEEVREKRDALAESIQQGRQGTSPDREGKGGAPCSR